MRRRRSYGRRRTTSRRRGRRSYTARPQRIGTRM